MGKADRAANGSTVDPVTLLSMLGILTLPVSAFGTFRVVNWVTVELSASTAGGQQVRVSG